MSLDIGGADLHVISEITKILTRLASPSPARNLLLIGINLRGGLVDHLWATHPALRRHEFPVQDGSCAASATSQDGTMATNATVPNRISLYPDQLRSLLSLARVLPARKYLVILALLNYLQGDSLKSAATREQIVEFTGLKKRTIYTYIQEFERCGLIKQWRGPFEVKQMFYRINLPVRQEVFDFYGKPYETIPSDHSIPSNSPIPAGLSEAHDADALPVPDAGETVSAQEEGMSEMTTDTETLAPAGETVTQTVLDPRIVQVLDRKATGDGNVIVKFLKRQGLFRINNFGTVRIDREGLLSYLLERDANSLEGFSRLVAEFKSSPQFNLPPDEDLQIDLHNNFFDYPYGAQWFWEECRVKDDNGLLLREGGFGANRLTFMAQHGLKNLDDVVQKVAQMHDELRPSPSVSSTSYLG